VSPAYHRVFSTPRELVHFIARMRELADGKPAGFKLCVGSRSDVLGICKAMVEEDLTPDFIIVDGGEGGTGAAPLEYEDHVGTPLTEGLLTVHNALVGVGLRDRVRIGASGKVATGVDLVKRLVQGADYTNAARAMMMAVGCIQAQTCHTNTCPVGVATQDPKRMRALDVGDKTERVHRYQRAVVAEAKQIIASMGLRGPEELAPHLLRRRIDHARTQSYAELFEHLEAGQLLAEPPRTWALDWELADPDRFVA
jgi:glutamate synthase domain-containing protein 2